MLPKKTQNKFALIDGNSFYASCQIAFDPSLEGRPVVVLSNNDGCIVAANQIAKNLNKELIAQKGSLGVRGAYQSAKPHSMMFQPYFKIKSVLKKHHAAVFSSNYELYADMSNRMHSIVGRFGTQQEIYSIDESFIDLTSLDHLMDLTAYGQTIKTTVKQKIGIPVAVGIGNSKTLAKLANHLAKKNSCFEGVLDLSALDTQVLDLYLAKVKVGDVWGIGKQLSAKLNDDGIETVAQLRKANLKTIRKKYGVVVERTVRELNGESCLALEEVVANKKQIISSRSFGRLVTEYKEMEQAVVTYIFRAGEKLRKQGSTCRMVTVYIHTNPHKKDHPQYKNSQTVPLVYPSDNAILFAKIAKLALKKIWRFGFAYQKAGIILSEIQPKGSLQEDLFAPNPTYSNNPKQDKLMKVMDSINKVEGRGTVFLASSGIERKNQWKMARNLMSPRYTTRWGELLIVR